MKYLLMIACLVFARPSYAQNKAEYGTFKSGIAAPGSLNLQNNYTFTPITESELLDRSFFTSNNRASLKTFVSGYERPGYCRPGEMMSTATMCSSVGNLKFRCNYYFDADGALQDGDISISKKK